MKSFIILVSLLYIHQTAFASGTTIGNGGNIIECKKDNIIQKLELFDFYEAREFRGLDQDPKFNKGTIKDLIKKVTDRLAKLSPQRAQFFLKKAENFFNEVHFMSPGTHLEPISDSEHIGLPNECHVDQVVAQRKPKFPEDKRYYINTDLWNRLDNKTKVGIILHELFYNEISYKAQNSIGVRYINSILWSSKSFLMEQNTFNDLLDKAGFCDFETQGAFLSSCADFIDERGRQHVPILYYPSGLIRAGAAVENSWIIIQKQKVYVTGMIDFYESGKIYSFTTNAEVTLQKKDGTFEHFSKGKEILLTEEGLVR